LQRSPGSLRWTTPDRVLRMKLTFGFGFFIGLLCQ
jgi:hypothetical protein